MAKQVVPLTFEEVIRVRKAMFDMKIGSREFGHDRPLYPEKLQSAVARQTAGYGGFLKYRKLEGVAATLFFGLACSHSFDNGNKRTALVSTLVLLEKNHASLGEATEDDLYLLATDVADHKQSFRFPESDPDSVVHEVAKWMRSRIRDSRAGYRPMRTGDFLKSLKKLGCEISSPDRSWVRVTPPDTSDGRVAKVAYAGDGRELSADYIRDIRQQLGLSLADGVDEATFFDLEPAVDRFVNEYRSVLDRLADA
ncbi:type II toxin-antitoxin system death-on-curing family toxin [Streptomyces microflavus]|uniref:type II toxin-antitoxin system death-on-curing family toxin n=1 Tax=Streptomyces microflavus TaxID=1919 RepID=UPI002E132F39|nr:type II toxin-antitoxin system death-on-curing family toxin [Streptomyces microflavus]WSR92639.1 type II toxin-antitoxin system death-on-curing family toxin [Streptomyces microflavus]